MNQNITNKLIVLPMLALTLALPLKSQAIWGMGDQTTDTANLGPNIAQTVTQVEQVVNMVQMVLKEFGLDTAIYKASQRASQKIVQKVLNNTNGGASGDEEPLFVTNFEEYYKSLDDRATNTFAQYMISQTDNPFMRSVGVAIANDQAGGGNPLKRFSLKDFDNWQGAINSIDAVGGQGWDFYSRLAFPENTPVGTSMIAQRQLVAKIQQQRDIATTELNSSGFKPDKGACSSSPEMQGFTQDPSTPYQPSSQVTPSAPSVNPGGQTIDVNNGGSWQGSWDAGLGGSSTPSTPDSNATTIAPQGNGTQTMTIGNDCFKAQIQTPRFSNESSVNQATVESFERLRASDEIGKFLSNTISSLIQGLIQKGLSSLNSDGGSSTTFYGGPRDVRTVLNSGQSWATTPEQIIDLQNEVAPAIQKTTLEIEYYERLLDAIKLPISGVINGEQNVAMRMEICLPGPDTDWETRLRDYALLQAEETNERAASSQNDQRATNNREAYTIVKRQTDQAVQESMLMISNPFLNIPAASEMKESLDEYYRTARGFRNAFDKTITKRQVLGRLQTIKAEIESYGQGMVMFRDQWDRLSSADRLTAYQSFTGQTISEFPEYTDPSDPSTLLPLPADDLTTAIDERDEEMRKRTIDLSWAKWEADTAEDDKQGLYAKFASMDRDISDSGTVQNLQVTANGAVEQVEELERVMSDCESIRQYVVQPGAAYNDQAFIDTLETSRVRNSFSGPSILNLNSSVNFTSLNQRLIQEVAPLPGFNNLNSGTYGGNIKAADPANTLQVQIATTPQQVIQQDNDQELFCRLTNYMLYYWAPSPTGEALTGKPISCRPRPNIDGFLDGGAQGSGNVPVQPTWYHTNAAEILFRINEE